MSPDGERAPLRVRFWGTRGSLPAPLSAAAVRKKIRIALQRAAGQRLDSDARIDEFLDRDLEFAVAGTYGGNSSCVELVTGGPDHVLCDLGSGAREFGNRVLAESGGKKHTFHVFMSHLHWDHIMGFPFFIPAYIPGHTIKIYGCHPVEEVMREAFQRQQSAPCFPVDFHQLGAAIEFLPLEVGRPYEIAGLTVRAMKQHHSGDSFGYRFERGGKALVYSTDSEHKYDSLDESYPSIPFFRDADAVIFDAMYTLADQISLKEDWGHSSNIIAVELCHLARVKHLVMYHHEPVFDDATISKILDETRRFEEIERADAPPLRVSAAHDGLELDL